MCDWRKDVRTGRTLVSFVKGNEWKAGLLGGWAGGTAGGRVVRWTHGLLGG